MLLTICIPTVDGRENQFDRLLSEIIRQSDPYPDVNILYAKDNKEMSIGAKRQLFVEQSEGEYILQVDDDDFLSADYLKTILPELRKKPDCIGYYEQVVSQSNVTLVKHSISCMHWSSNPLQRTPFYKTPIKTSICKKVGFNDMRYGEDFDFSIRVFPYLKNEIFLNKAMYIYNQPYPLSPKQHNERYGIK